MKNDEFDLLYAFPKYRRAKNRIKELNRENRRLYKNWGVQVIKNEKQKEKIIRLKSLVEDLRKEIKGDKNENVNKQKNIK
jgi:hypothetical protein